MIGMDSGIYARYLDPRGGAACVPRLDMATAGWLSPDAVLHDWDLPRKLRSSARRVRPCRVQCPVSSGRGSAPLLRVQPGIPRTPALIVALIGARRPAGRA